jgi:hypothetical protein
MQIYLAARYGRRAELHGYAATLRALGHTSTATWLEQADRGDDDGIHLPACWAAARAWAVRDMMDLAAADCLILWTEAPGMPWGRGGRHVELGLALAWRKDVLLIGPVENIFCTLASQIFPTWDDAVAWLCRDAPEPPA